MTEQCLVRNISQPCLSTVYLSHACFTVQSAAAARLSADNINTITPNDPQIAPVWNGSLLLVRGGAWLVSLKQLEGEEAAGNMLQGELERRGERRK